MLDHFFESLPFILFMIFVVNSGLGVRGHDAFSGKQIMLSR